MDAELSVSLAPKEAECVSELTVQMREYIQKFPELEEVLEQYVNKGKSVGEPPYSIYLRYLRARNFNVNLAFTMLTDALEWRKDFQGIGVDNITIESISNTIKQARQLHLGFDKQQRPILYIRVKRFVKDQYKAEEIFREGIYLLEEMRKTAYKPPVDSVTIVFDMQDFSVTKNMLKGLPLGEIHDKCAAVLLPRNIRTSTVAGCPLDISGVLEDNKGTDLTKFVEVDQLWTEYGGTLRYSPEEEHSPTGKNTGSN